MIFDPLACHVQQFLHYNIQLYLVTFDPVLSMNARIKNLETEKVKLLQCYMNCGTTLEAEPKEQAN